MSQALGAMFAMPGYVDPGTPDQHTMETKATAAVEAAPAANTLKIAWLIVVLSLLALWALGWAFSK